MAGHFDSLWAVEAGPVSSALSLPKHTGGSLCGPRTSTSLPRSALHLPMPLIAWHPRVPSHRLTTGFTLASEQSFLR